MALVGAIVGGITGGVFMQIEYMIHPPGPNDLMIFTWVDGFMVGALWVAVIGGIGSAIAFGIVGAYSCLSTAPLQLFKASLRLGCRKALLLTLVGLVLGSFNNLI